MSNMSGSARMKAARNCHTRVDERRRESDESLMMRYGRGEAAAFERLYRRHEMRIWRYLERNVGNRAMRMN